MERRISFWADSKLDIDFPAYNLLRRSLYHAEGQS